MPVGPSAVVRDLPMVPWVVPSWRPPSWPAASGTQPAPAERSKRQPVAPEYFGLSSGGAGCDSVTVHAAFGPSSGREHAAHRVEAT